MMGSRRVCAAKPSPGLLVSARVPLAADTSSSDEWTTITAALELSNRCPSIAVAIHSALGDVLLGVALDSLASQPTPEHLCARAFLVSGALVWSLPPPSPTARSRSRAPPSAEHLAPDPASLVPAPAHVQLAVAAHCFGVNVFLQHTRCIMTARPDEARSALQALGPVWPAALRATMHQFCVLVPARVAALVAADSQLASAAATAYCEADKLELAAVRAMKLFSPAGAPTVLTRIALPRHTYAALVSRPMDRPPLCFGRPPLPQDPLSKAFACGWKVAVGFELLAHSVRLGDPRIATVQPADDDPDTQLQWSRLLEALERRAFFSGTLSTSPAYAAKLAEARAFFDAQRRVPQSPKCARDRLEMGGCTTRVLAQRSLVLLWSRLSSCVVPPSLEPADVAADDTDDWLLVDPDECEQQFKLLYSASDPKRSADTAGHQTRDGRGERRSGSDEEGLQESVELLNRMVAGVKRFVNQSSEFDGVTCADDPAVSERAEATALAAARSAPLTDGFVRMDPDRIAALLGRVALGRSAHDSCDVDSDDEEEDPDNVETGSLRLAEALQPLRQLLERMSTAGSNAPGQSSSSENYNGRTTALDSDDAESDAHSSDDDFLDVDDDNNNDDDDDDAVSDDDFAIIRNEAKDMLHALSQVADSENTSSMKYVMKAMDAELDESLKVGHPHASDSAEEEHSRAEIDAQVVEGLLQSFAAEHGLPGPVSLLLSALNIPAPPLPAQEGRSAR
jgi:hypothetical protein